MPTNNQRTDLPEQPRMTLAQATVGQRVTYHPGHGPVEHGQITSVDARFVFVQYDTDLHAKGADPGMLTLDTVAVTR